MSGAGDDRDYIAQMRQLGDFDLLQWWLEETIRQCQVKSAAIRAAHAQGETRQVWEVLHGLVGAAGSGLVVLLTAAKPLLEKYRHADAAMMDSEVEAVLEAIERQRVELVRELETVRIE